MPLFETLPIDQEEVKSILAKEWNLEIDSLIKASQNHTFLAKRNGSGEKFIVRVTPDPKAQKNECTKLELKLLKFLKENQLPVCSSVPTNDGREFIKTDSSLLIAVFEFAPGNPINFVEYKFITQENQVKGLGRWMAKFHSLSRTFAKQNPQDLKQARRWTELHDGVLSQVVMDEKDTSRENDPESFGLIHGDINVSNFFWDEEKETPIMFDWDQAQLSWFMYDLSSPIWTIVVLANGGSPIDGSQVPQADVHKYTELIVEGYESESGKKVDREELKRMITLRRELYKRFCTRAVEELAPDHPMYKFCSFMSTWLSKEE